MKQVAVVGAGAAGLAATRWLVQSGLWNNVCTFERNHQVGGAWIYKEDDGLCNSSMYKSLRTNLPKETMMYPDFPFDENLPTFMGHEDVLQYLEHFCMVYDLKKHIQFGSSVIDIAPVDPSSPLVSGWNVKWLQKDVGDNMVEREDKFDNVVICNGHFSTPYFPMIVGLDKFKGTTSHSHSYRTGERYKGKRVVILGNGASAVDISLELSEIATTLYHCKRAGPATLFGTPPDSIIAKACLLSIDENGDLLLEDGSRLSDIDHIIFCTGYHYDYPFLNKSAGIDIGYKQVKDLYKQIFPFNKNHPQFTTNPKQVIPPTISFIGLQWKSIQFPIYDIQIRYIIDIWGGKYPLPSMKEIKASIEEDKSIIVNSNLPEHYLHSLGERQWEYCESLNKNSSKKSEITDFLNTIRPMYNAAAEIRHAEPGEYKNMNIQLQESGEWTFI